MELQQRTEAPQRLTWTERFNRAITRFSNFKGTPVELIHLTIASLQEWADSLPYSFCDDRGYYKPVNTWGLGPEKTEIDYFINLFSMDKENHLANPLRHAFYELYNSAAALDELYPKTAAQDEATEERLIQMCKRQVKRLSSILERLLKVAFKYVHTSEGGQHPAGSSTTSASYNRKRSKRAAEIELLEKALTEHIKSAADGLQAAMDAGKEPVLLPRPQRVSLAKEIGISKVAVSRCFNDPNAHKLRILWDTADSPDKVLRFKRF